jgi:hypothetical protein
VLGLETVEVGMSSRRARLLAAANVLALAGSVALAGWGAVDGELWFAVASAIVAGAAGAALGFISGSRTMPAREHQTVFHGSGDIVIREGLRPKQTAEVVRYGLVRKANRSGRRKRRATLGAAE